MEITRKECHKMVQELWACAVKIDEMANAPEGNQSEADAAKHHLIRVENFLDKLMEELES